MNTGEKAKIEILNQTSENTSSQILVKYISGNINVTKNNIYYLHIEKNIIDGMYKFLIDNTNKKSLNDTKWILEKQFDEKYICNYIKEKLSDTNNIKRDSIPTRVRREVWKRDEGKCVKCGSRLNLEYDHIIPISPGGGNTARNIELLCEKCNREKSNKII